MARDKRLRMGEDWHDGFSNGSCRGPRDLTHAEAAEILGVRPTTVASMVHRGELKPRRPRGTAQLSRDDVERLAARRAARRPNPYFVTAEEAAKILGVVRQWVDQLALDGRLPYVETGVGRPTRLYRRAQIEVLANSRLRGRTALWGAHRRAGEESKAVD